MAILLIVAVLLVVVGGPVLFVNRDLLFRRTTNWRTTPEEPLPFLIFPVAGTPQPAPTVAKWAPSDRVVKETAPRFAPPDHENGNEMIASSRTVDSPARADLELAPAQPPYPTAADDDATIVFTRPVDEPIRILPGRLRVLSRDGNWEDLRLFNRLGDAPQLLVGREAGPAYRHITLNSPTVSRRHARMDFIDGGWTITNLSATNPVLVNDRALARDGDSRKLSDGDRIELGEVAIRFMAS